MTTATPTTRREQIDRYVELEALGTVLRGGMDISFEALIPGLDDLEAVGMSALFDELWPNHEDTETGEYMDAQIRSSLLAIKLFSVLAERIPHEIVQLARWVEDNRPSAERVAGGS